MLHEILLSLSGHASPLLSATASKGDGQHSKQTFPGLSPPEQALLASLAHLGDVHVRLQSRTSVISSTHPSTICRAISAAVASTHLARFQQTILDLENSILRKDSSTVGGYGIVPLSRVADEFGQWTRRMNWFWEMVEFMLPDQPRSKKSSGIQSQCSGAAVLNQLRKEVQTGYPDIEEAALDLIKAGETAWLRQLSAWVLYGRLPAFGQEDFFICTDASPSQNTTTTRLPEFYARHELNPGFVAPNTASAILFIGRSLNQIRARSSLVAGSSSTARTSPELVLVPVHLKHLAALSSPITQSSLSSAISAIRLSLSRNSLQQLLPLQRIQEILKIFRSFFLLDRGEFAVALLNEAQKRIRSRQRGPMAPDRGGLSDGLRNLNIKESEANLVLTRTWATLSSSQSRDDDDNEEEMDLARRLMHFTHAEPNGSSSKLQSIASQGNGAAAVSEVAFHDFLFATPTTLTIQITSPLDLFLRPEDLMTYSHIHSYVLSIRRAHLHLTELWRLTSLRRDHPAPLGPPASNTRSGAKILTKARQLELNRRKAMRQVWATVGATLFFLTELSGYFQGEVIKRSTDKLRLWLQPTLSSQREHREFSRPTTSGSVGSSQRDGDKTRLKTITASGANLPNFTSPDPETLTSAHQRYLRTLLHNLLLTDTVFTRSLRSLLVHIDHFVALITRLHSIQQSMDLGVNEATADPFADYAAEEKELITDLRNARKELDRGTQALVTRLGDMDSERVGGNTQSLVDGKIEEGEFIPWSGNGLDRLLMKLDFASLQLNGEGRGGS